MTNSLIVNRIIKAAHYIMSTWAKSACFRLLQKLDRFLSKAAENSFFTKVFTIYNENGIMKHSIIICNISILANKFFSAKNVFANKIQQSFFVTLFKNIIDKSIENPLKVSGVFLSAFMLSNILYDIVLNHINVLALILKLFVLTVSIFVSFLNIDIRQSINESKFIKLCKWFLSYEN